MEQEAQTHHHHNHPNSDYTDYLHLAVAVERQPIALVEAESGFD